MVTTIFENHALAMDVVRELLDHSTIHPKKQEFSKLEAKTMTLERLYKESQSLLEELKDYPNIIVLQEYVKRMGYFVGNRDAS
jgi:L-rhamnose isomerase